MPTIPELTAFFGLIAFTLGVFGAVTLEGLNSSNVLFSPAPGQYFANAIVPVIFLGISFLLLFTALQRTKKVERYNA